MVARGPDAKLVGMGDIHIWHYADTWLNPERQGLRSGFIDNLWVEPEYRRSGVARAIVEAFFEFAAEKGLDELILEYALHNKEAARFLGSSGLQADGSPRGSLTARRPCTAVRLRMAAARTDDLTVKEIKS